MNFRRTLLVWYLLITALLSAWGEQLCAKPLIFGMSAPLRGDAASLGHDFRLGTELVFDAINKQGGLAGQQLQLLVLDDGYEPINTVNNTRRLLMEHKVFALYGYVGTPTVNAALPLLKHQKTSLFMPMSGAAILRQPEDSHIFNFRASYDQEAQAQVRFVLSDPKLQRIALLVQADEFGATLEAAFLKALTASGRQPVAVLRFKRNSQQFDDVVQQLRRSSPDVVLTTGPYQPIATIINKGRSLSFHPLYGVVSFTGLHALSQHLMADQRLFGSMVVPPLTDTNNELVKAYLLASKNANQTHTSDIALEGFAAATLLTKALSTCIEMYPTTVVTADCLFRTLPNVKLTEFPLSYDPQQRQASQQVFLVKRDINGQFRYISTD